MSNCTFSHNFGSSAGGIYNTGTLTVSNCTFSGNLGGDAGLSGTITLTTGALTISKDIIIAGPGPGVITVSGNKTFQVFTIAPAVTVTVSGLTIANGTSALFGGGISNDGILIVSNSTVLGSVAGNRGGGIYNSPSGTLLAINSIIAGNSATNAGGGSARALRKLQNVSRNTACFPSCAMRNLLALRNLLSFCSHHKRRKSTRLSWEATGIDYPRQESNL